MSRLLRSRGIDNDELSFHVTAMWMEVLALEKSITQSWKEPLGSMDKRPFGEMEALYQIYNRRANEYVMYAQALDEVRALASPGIWFPVHVTFCSSTLWKLTCKSSRGGYHETDFTPVRLDTFPQVTIYRDRGVANLPPLIDYVCEERECDSPCCSLCLDTDGEK